MKNLVNWSQGHGVFGLKMLKLIIKMSEYFFVNRLIN